MKKIFILTAMLASIGLTANAQRGIQVYDKNSDAPVAAMTFAEIKSLKFSIPSVVLMAKDDTEVQTLDIKQLKRIVITDDITMAIKDVSTEDRRLSSRTYNVMGQEVPAGVRGIVIKNGKKHLNR